MKNSMKTSMQKLLSLSLMAALFVPFAALADTAVSFSPASFSVTEGQSFSANIFVDPRGTENYTVKIEIDYPAELVRVDSFEFASGLMPISQDGYDSIDNTSGTLVKSAGFPGGVASHTRFGTISFTAIGSGSGSIRLNNSESFALDGDNNDVLDSQAVSAQINISGLEEESSVVSEQPEQTETAAPPASAPRTAPAPDSEEISEEEVESESEESGEETGRSLAAASAAQAGSAGDSALPRVFIAIAALLLAGGGIYAYWRKRRGK